MDPTNPYEPPTASIANPAAAAAPAAGRSRWLPLRWLPMALLGVIAAGSWLGAVFLAATIVWAIWTGTGQVVSSQPQMVEMVWSVPGLLVYGTLSFAAARAWFACRWKLAIALTILWYATGVAAAFLLRPSR